jgi:putative ABC transport system ATP-binding protein
LSVLRGSIHAPVVAGRDLTRRYGEGPTAVNALNGVTIELEKSSFTAIMGPSGSGKSTLLHLLAGLDRPTSGDVWLGPTKLSGLGDADLTRLRRTRVGFVFQTFNLLPALTAEENIVLPLRISGAELDPQWFERLIAAVGLADRLSHRPAELSGGEQQRVALARALITRPAVVFADEPTGNLDSAASEVVLTMLREAVDKLFQTIAIVTHDPLAAAHADRIVFLGDGRIVRRDTRLTSAQILDALKALY